MSMEIFESEYKGMAILSLRGRVKGEGDEKLAKALDGLASGKASSIVVDLSEADYIDSHGLGVIIYHHKMLQGTKRKLVLLNENKKPDSYMNRLVEITNLDKVIPLVRSKDELG